ncbi:hypothetical protein QBC36DRAFT_331274 [Triangularia setosa]|uniref:Uncharacterized protein n=1 Tax=Triangularia setosa TaxID=2587417 RepID=A0AAN6W530_9PEZI|nr:hypothetical protein QBC36DRAFT_331274 [Podospora setosa]
MFVSEFWDLAGISFSFFIIMRYTLATSIKRASEKKRLARVYEENRQSNLFLVYVGKGWRKGQALGVGLDNSNTMI